MYRRPDGTLIVSATDLVGFLECRHLTNLNRGLVEGLVARPDRGDDAALELLQRRGWAHEERYIEWLERRDGRTVSRLDGSYERPTEARVAETEQAMRRGDDVIFQATVFDGRWVGHPDFLLRVPGRSALGDWHYEVADTKLAHSAKASALIQISSYVEQIERVQDVRPETAYVVTGGAEIEVHALRTAEMMAYYRQAKARFEAELAGQLDLEATYPDPVEHCAVCKWFYAQCRPTWRADDALPLVAGITRAQRQELRALGLSTRSTLAAAEVGQRFERVHHQARVQVDSDGLAVPAHELLELETDADGGLLPDRGLAALPRPDSGDLFFDIEGDPFAFWAGLEYLFGIWDGAAYRQLWAMNREQEKVAFEQAIDLFTGHLAQHPEMHIYHYGAYEPSRLKQLAGRHATREEQLDRLLRGRVFVDLYRVVRQGLRVGTERYSIKNLEPLYGYVREIELRDANSSIVEFEKLLEEGDPDDALKNAIAGYNRDDCLSTHRLRDWLELQRAAAEAKFEVTLPRPLVGDQAPISEELSDRIRAVRELTTRLTADIPPAPTDQTDADRHTWLVAHLLDWHRREDKSTWWRFFDLLARSDEELVEESEPIGGLRFVAMTELGGRSRSNLYRYSFPAQEYKIEAGDSLNDPALFAAGQRTATGTVQAIDDDARWIDIKRPRTWTGPHPTSVVALDVIDARAQREALMRLGEWVADNGIDSPSGEWRAGRDLLRLRPPRLTSGSGGGQLVDVGETGTQAARRLAPLLDGTTLAIQGPPGSGKTYTGARMIVDLIGAGRAVGISSNSHKVIGNLLTAVLDAAAEAGLTVRAAQKAKEHEAVRHPAVKRVEDNADVDEALAEGAVDVVAGTPWLWARQELAGSIDTLFVDEAGQVSLANVLAMSGAARNVVLLGDPQQLDQPTQGVHPDGAGRSALGHFLGDLETVPEERGVFLERTFRLHPAITSFTSDLFYEGKLASVDGLEGQRVTGDDWLSGSGLRWVPVEHEGNTNESAEEAQRVAQIVSELRGRPWVDRLGRERPLGWADIVIVSPFNAHRLLIQRLLGAQARVGTVDKFQGQQAPVSIYTMATSRPEDAPRGLGFLYSLNRLNVATSRAQALAIVVASPALLAAVPRSVNELRMANGLCAFVEHAQSA
jgi:predicted RecB family nuclease